MISAPAHDADLTWLFEMAESAIGWASSFDPLCAIAMSGLNDGSGAARSPDGRMVRIVGKGPGGQPLPAAKLRALTEAWNALPVASRQVLHGAYARHRVHPQHKKKLGHWPGVVVILPMVVEQYDDACRRIQANHLRHQAQSEPEVRTSRASHSIDDGERVQHDQHGTVVYRPGGSQAEVPTLLEWLTESRGPRIDAGKLRCGDSVSGTNCCAVHTSESAVGDAWAAWNELKVAALKRHNMLRHRATPRSFSFRRDED